MLFPYVLDVKNSVETAVTGTHAESTLLMTAHKVYAYCCNVGSWIKQDAAANSPVASVGAGSAFIPANTIVMLDGSFGDTLSIIRDGAVSGQASLTPCVQSR